MLKYPEPVVELIIDDCDKSYNPGDTVRGRVKCKFSGTANIQGVWVEIVGEETLGRSKQVLDIYDKNDVPGSRTFLASKCLVMDVHQPMSHTFGYGLKLPKNIPSTFSNRNGSVRIFVKAIVRIDDSNNDDVQKVKIYEREGEIKVVSPIDFRSRLGLDVYKKPVTETVRKTFPVLWCISRGQIDMDVSFSKRAFVLGEVAEVEVIIANMSAKPIDRIVFILEQIITSRYDIANVLHREAVISETWDGLAAYRRRTYNIVVKIPVSLNIPNFALCKLFKDDYQMQIIAVLSKSSNMKLSTPVVLGHISDRTETELVTAEPQPQRLGETTMYPPSLPPPTTLLSKKPSIYSSLRPAGFVVPKPLYPDQKMPPPYPSLDLELPTPPQDPIRVPSPPSSPIRRAPKIGALVPMPASMPSSSQPPYPSQEKESQYLRANRRYSQGVPFGAESYRPPSQPQPTYTAPYTPMPRPPPPPYSSSDLELPTPPQYPIRVPSPPSSPIRHAPKIGALVPMPASMPSSPQPPYPSQEKESQYLRENRKYSQYVPFGAESRPASEPQPTTTTPYVAMPLPPPKHQPTSTAPYPTMPLPPSDLYPPERPMSYTAMPMPCLAPYPTEKRPTGWDHVRTAIPYVAARHSIPFRSGIVPYPPENRQSTEWTPFAATASNLPYPPEEPPPKPHFTSVSITSLVSMHEPKSYDKVQASRRQSGVRSPPSPSIEYYPSAPKEEESASQPIGFENDVRLPRHSRTEECSQ